MTTRLPAVLLSVLLPAFILFATACEGVDQMFRDSGSGNASASNEPLPPPQPESSFGGSSTPGSRGSTTSRGPVVNVSDTYLYVIRYLPGPNWRAGAPTADQPGYSRHLQSMRNWSAQGIVVLGGPMVSDQGSCAIIRAASLRDAQDLAATDGGVIDGTFRPEVTQMVAQFPN
ncbi:MAG: hypothetical protein H6809_07555 [Phycisphaeraceae bacterium]|nr:hypothetical protein [Phycisphaeraceae bacterium]